MLGFTSTSASGINRKNFIIWEKFMLLAGSNKRSVDGLLLFDKPLHGSSNAALQQVKRLLAGHTGSLDPLATGMLPICFGEATKFSQFLLDADKHYSVIAQLGIKTATGDAEGAVICERPVNPISMTELEEILEQFRGVSSQIPSMYSALKFQGKPLYQLARQGKEIERASRQITIHRLQLMSYENNQLTLEVQCSKGTYIRNLVEDIGEALACGAYVRSLRRTAINDFQAAQMYTLEQLNEQFAQGDFPALDSCLLPITAMLKNIPIINFDENNALALQRGQTVILEKELFQHLFMTDTAEPILVQLMVNCERFIGIGELSMEGKLISRRLLQIK
jgi:tRNA pseudouridine55 synthase